MSSPDHSRWLRGALLVAFGSGCQVVLGDFSVDTSEAPVVLMTECRPNAYHCEGATLRICADDRSGYRVLEECASADECDPTAGACRPCTTGDFACNENLLLRCAAGSWTSAGECESIELCQVGLNRREGRCRPAMCVPGAVQCRDGAFERCSPSGERWELVERCAAAENCIAEPAEEAGCLPAACEGEDCPPSECEVGRLRCDPLTRLALQRCDSSGRFVTQEACAASSLCRDDLGACLPPACERNEKRCLGQKYQTCRGDRAWFQTTRECAADQTCDPAVGCVRGTCTDGAQRCNDAAFERCVDGAWAPQQICITKDLCDASTGCQEPECGGALPSFRCVEGEVIQQCASGRHLWEEIGYCPGQRCVPERPFCVPL